jgi:hypothetical protein
MMPKTCRTLGFGVIAATVDGDKVYEGSYASGSPVATIESGGRITGAAAIKNRVPPVLVLLSRRRIQLYTTSELRHEPLFERREL